MSEESLFRYFARSMLLVTNYFLLQIQYKNCRLDAERFLSAFWRQVGDEQVREGKWEAGPCNDNNAGRIAIAEKWARHVKEKEAVIPHVAAKGGRGVVNMVEAGGLRKKNKVKAPPKDHKGVEATCRHCGMISWIDIRRGDSLAHCNPAILTAPLPPVISELKKAGLSTADVAKSQSNTKKKNGKTNTTTKKKKRVNRRKPTRKTNVETTPDPDEDEEWEDMDAGAEEESDNREGQHQAEGAAPQGTWFFYSDTFISSNFQHRTGCARSRGGGSRARKRLQWDRWAG